MDVGKSREETDSVLSNFRRASGLRRESTGGFCELEWVSDHLAVSKVLCFQIGRRDSFLNRVRRAKGKSIGMLSALFNRNDTRPGGLRHSRGDSMVLEV